MTITTLTSLRGNSLLLPQRPTLTPTSGAIVSKFRVVCKSQFKAEDLNLKLVLHDALDSSGTDTTHARAARDGFTSQLQRMTDIERETSICINRCVDLGRTALCIAAEDDSLISHSSVPLPVDAFLERLDNLSTGYCPYYRSSVASAPEDLLDSIEKYLYISKGFRRINAGQYPEPKAFYLHSVLTKRSGSAVILSLVYAEFLKMLQLWGIIDFDVEIFYPSDNLDLPRAYNKRKSKESDQQHIMTTESLMVDVLRNLKNTYWPFRRGQTNTNSLFLGAAEAAMPANYTDSGFVRASAKAAQHRLDRGVWTSVLFGDMRCALSACERLILIGADWVELRDYAVLLYHCGYYEEALRFLQLYKEAKKTSNILSTQAEDDALEQLMVRLNLILMEEGWRPPIKNFLQRNSEPW